MFDTAHVLLIYVVWFVCAFGLAYLLIKKNS